MKTKLWMMLISLGLLMVACGGEDTAEESAPEVIEEESAVQVADDFRPRRPAELPTFTIENIVDGQTLETSDGRAVRLVGLGLPPAENRFADSASTYLREVVLGNEVGYELAGALNTEGEAIEWAHIWLGDDLVNYELVRLGFAYRILMPPEAVYDTYLTRVQENALAAGIGLWDRADIALQIDVVTVDPVGADDENLNGEVVKILNHSPETIDLQNFTLMNGRGQSYVFDSLNLESGTLIQIFSGCGADRTTRVYWCADQEVWDNRSDSVFLYDDTMQLIDFRGVGLR